MKKVYVVMVDYRGGEGLKRCLTSLREAIVPFDWSKEVLVIDNNQTNRGFSKAANMGIKEAMKSGANAVLLLNPDTEVKKDFLIPLLDNTAAIVAPVIRYKSQRGWRYDFGGKIDWRWGRTKHNEDTKILRYKDIKLEYISGCAMLIKRPLMEKIGLLDEKYFLYFEDVDYCLRAQKAGFKITVERKSLITHHLKDPENRPFKQRWHLWKSNLLFINQYIYWPQRLLAYGYLLVLLIKLLI